MIEGDEGSPLGRQQRPTVGREGDGVGWTVEPDQRLGLGIGRILPENDVVVLPAAGQHPAVGCEGESR